MEKIKIIKRKINYDEMMKDLNQAWLQTKIENYIGRFPFLNLSVSDIKKKISEDPAFAMFFIKDPSRQRIGTEVVKELLQGAESVDGLLDIRDGQSGYEDIDYVISCNGTLIYIIAVSISGTGGNQNMRHERIVERVNNSHVKHGQVIVFALGDYYDISKARELERSNVAVIHGKNIDEWEEIING